MSHPANPLDLRRLPGRPPLVVADPRGDGPEWAAEHRQALRGVLAQRGSVLVRGLGLRDDAAVAALFGSLAPSGLMPEAEPFAPRRSHPGGVYSSTTWPANQQMCVHHETSYAVEFPGLMMFACLVAPPRGGATVVADAAAVLQALPRDLVARFDRTGWLLVRNYNDGIGASWPEAFGTSDARAVERYCRARAIELEWQPGGGLRTWQRRRAVVRHPVTGHFCWFNQIAFLSEWTLDQDVREFLVETYGLDGLPFSTRFGDGSPVGPDVVALLNDVYERHSGREPWRPGDVLLVDNVRTAHGRDPYEGPREVRVGMADPVHADHVAPGATAAAR